MVLEVCGALGWVDAARRARRSCVTPGAEVVPWSDLRTSEIEPFVAVSVEAAARRLQAECEALADLGFEAAVSPAPGPAWASNAITVWSDGSPRFVSEPETGEVDLEAHVSAGFGVAAVLTSLRARTNVHAESDAGCWDGNDAGGALAEIHGVLGGTHEDDPFWRCSGVERFSRGLSTLLNSMDPRCVVTARDEHGRLGGFAIAMKDELRGGSLIARIYGATSVWAARSVAGGLHRLASEEGIPELVLAMSRDYGNAARTNAAFGGRPFRRYVLMAKRL